jgi:hypothetical protein
MQNNSLVDDDLPPVYHNDDGSLDNLVDDEAEDVTLADLSHCTVDDPRLTYQFVAEKATNLVRLAQSDQKNLVHSAICWISLRSDFEMGIVLIFSHFMQLFHLLKVTLVLRQFGHFAGRPKYLQPTPQDFSTRE